MIIPSIDLMKGKAVQLREGKEKVLEKEDPLSILADFTRYCETAVIDLDAALGKGDNLEIIKELCSHGDCRVGGGIRDVKKAKEIISYGANKIITGSAAFEGDKINIEFLRNLNSAVGKERIIIAADIKDGTIVTKGWTHNTGLPLLETIRELSPWCSEFLITTVEKEGHMKGVDLDTAKSVREVTDCVVTIAGGVSDIRDITELAEMGLDVQVGMSLYTGRIKTDDAFINSLKFINDVIPTVTTDSTGQVLMTAYSNKESLSRTFSNGFVHYFSPSRNEILKKGETTGNLQRFLKVRADCNRETLLFTVDQNGSACHTGQYSCFADKKFNLKELYTIISGRLKNKDAGSYTASLTLEDAFDKFKEESGEFINSFSRENMVWEAADVLYFLTVILAKSDIDIDEVLSELRRRRRK